MKFWFTQKKTKTLLLEQVDTCGDCNVVGILGAINASLWLFWAGPGHKAYSLLGVDTCGDCNVVGILGAINEALQLFGAGPGHSVYLLLGEAPQGSQK